MFVISVNEGPIFVFSSVYDILNKTFMCVLFCRLLYWKGSIGKEDWTQLHMNIKDGESFSKANLLDPNRILLSVRY